MKVVLDTNVLVAALLGGKGPNREVVRHCLTGTLKPQLAAALYFEYEDLFERQNILALCKLTKEQQQLFWMLSCQFVTGINFIFDGAPIFVMKGITIWLNLL